MKSASIRLAMLACVFSSLAACTTTRSMIAKLPTVKMPEIKGPGVKPWERDVLARPEMAPDFNILTLKLDDHIYFSKEATSGGRGFGGGGCGCN
jgi:hypothetical protein